MDKTSVPPPSPPAPAPPHVTVSRFHFWLFNMGSSFAVRQPDTALGSQRKKSEGERGIEREGDSYTCLFYFSCCLPLLLLCNFPNCLLSRLLPFLTLLSIFGFCFCFCLFWVALLAVLVVLVVLCFTGTLVFLVYLSELIALFSYNFRTLARCVLCCQFQSQFRPVGPPQALLPVASCQAEATGYTCTGTPREHCAAATAALAALLCSALLCCALPPSGTTCPQSSTSAAATFHCPPPSAFHLHCPCKFLTWNRSETFHQSGLY